VHRQAETLELGHDQRVGQVAAAPVPVRARS
jgi:hypothetical protein